MADTSIFERKIDPLYQAGGALAASFLFMVIGSAIGAGTEEVVTTTWPWLCATSFLLFFSVFNAIMSATTKELMKYWGRSMYAFLGLAALSGLLAWGFSGLSIGEAGSYQWMFFVVGFVYLVFLSMVAFMKRIVEFAQKEEWNRPKLKQRKRKR